MTTMTMTSRVVPVTSIEFNQQADDDRTFRLDFAEELAVSIEADGLLQPLVVRPIPDQPNRYRLVAGRHRLHAVSEILGWSEVICNVREDMGDDESEAANLAENVFRNNLSPDQLNRSLIRWHALYEKRFPLANGRGSSKRRDAANRHAIAENETAKLIEEAKPFAQVIESTLGVSRATAGRYARVARNVTEEQITVLAANGVTQVFTDKIAALDDPHQIERCVQLINSGSTPLNALKTVGEEDTATKTSKASMSVTPSTAAMMAPDESLTDEDWLARNCDHLLRRLKRTESFKADALLWRHMEAAVQAFKRATRRTMLHSKSVSTNRPYYAGAFRLLNANHPRTWNICGSCSGGGVEKANPKSSCRSCLGSGYKVSIAEA
jgi:ParB/RepB/Spo0J family partition protein